MHFENLVTRSAAILRRHPWLWPLALLAGEASGFGGSGNGTGTLTRPSPGSSQVSPPDLSWVPGWILDRAGLILEVAAAVLAAWLLLLLLSCVAEGALIAAVARIDAGEKFGFGAAWGAGMRSFWRVLGFRLCTALAVVLPLLLLAAIPFAGYANWGQGGLIKGLLLDLPILVAYYFYVFVIGYLATVGLRACVLDGSGPVASYRAAYRLVARRFSRVGLTWLVALAVSIAFGIVFQVVLAIVAVPFTAPLLNALAAGRLADAVTGLLTLLAVSAPISLLLSSLAGAYLSILWTVAYRRFDAGDEVPEPAPLAA